jgi:SAM-dependent methyltransferase
VRCEICSADTTRLFQANGYWIRQCRPCQYRFAEIAADRSHVCRTYGESYFFGGGAGYADYLSEESLLIAQGRYYARRIAKAARPGRLLDVGAAAGFVMEGFRQCGWSVAGIEPNPQMAAFAKDRFGHPLHVGSLEDAEIDGVFDLVTMIEVAPHFWDARQAFAKASALTARSGHWLVEAWNYRSWTARLFGKRWHEYSPPSVLHWFSPRSLALLASQFGMESVAQGRPVKRINGLHARSLLKYRLGQLGGGRLQPLANIIPAGIRLRYPADDLYWMLFRKK